MTLSNGRGLTYEANAAAIENLVANDIPPESMTVRDIREETGTGSYSTIRMHRDRWLRERREAVIKPFHIDGSELDGLRFAVELLFAQKTNDMRAEVELSAAKSREVIDRLELDLDEVLKINDELQAQYRGAVTRVEALQLDVIAANLRADELAAASAELRESQRNSLVDTRPVQQIPPAPCVGPEAGPLASSEMGAGQ